jgi:GNAT superfamily N-acetyltransferase
MRSIQLLTITPALCEALHTPDEFARLHDAQLGPHADLVRQVVADGEAYRRTTGAPPEWGTSLGVDAESRLVVGTCAFKSAPRADGGIEIAYFTFPAFEGQGYAGAMAAALVRRAEASGMVRVVHAHTLPELNASARLLARLGFTCTGTVIDDPADGPVWHWERPVAADATTHHAGAATSDDRG